MGNFAAVHDEPQSRLETKLRCELGGQVQKWRPESAATSVPNDYATTMQIMATWKLFWVTTPSPSENCFVVAKTPRDAASLEESGSGFETGDCGAVYVAPIAERFEKIAAAIRKKELKLDSEPWPDYARPWLLTRMGAERQMRNGRNGWSLNGHFFAPGTFEEDFLNKHPFLIKRVEDLLRKINSLKGGKWVFRGQSDAVWGLRCGIDRMLGNRQILAAERVSLEKSLLEEFKRRAVP